MNVRIKFIRNLSISQRTERSIQSPQNQFYQKQSSRIDHDEKRSKSSAVIFQKQEQSPRKIHLKKQICSPTRQIFSKIKLIQPQISQKSPQKVRSLTLPQEKCSLNLKRIKSPRQSQDLTNHTEQINKFPHYVSKSNQMVQMKQKLLQLKHKIKFNNSFPVLENIQDSINVNRAWFTRKMKVQVCKKGNTQLMENFEKDLSQYLENESPQKSKSQERHYRPIDLPYLIAIQHKNQNSFQNYQRVQKMEEIKKNLKAVRKTNLKKLK